MPRPKISSATKVAVARPSADERADRAAGGSAALADTYSADELRARLERALVLALRLEVELGDTRLPRAAAHAPNQIVSSRPMMKAAIASGVQQLRLDELRRPRSR